MRWMDGVPPTLRPAIIEPRTLVGAYITVIESTQEYHHLGKSTFEKKRRGNSNSRKGSINRHFKKLTRPCFTSEAQACRWCP